MRRNDCVWAILSGGHRAARKVRVVLGFDPNIHSGMAGQGRVCLHLTDEEFDRLRSDGFKVSRDSRFKAGEQERRERSGQ